MCIFPCAYTLHIILWPKLDSKSLCDHQNVVIVPFLDNPTKQPTDNNMEIDYADKYESFWNFFAHPRTVHTATESARETEREFIKFP